MKWWEILAENAKREFLATKFMEKLWTKYKSLGWNLQIGNIRCDTGVINAPVGRSNTDRKKMCVTETGRNAVTHYTVLERLEKYTYMQFQLETGRTHQIRVHMAHIGHPVVGDKVYGPKKDAFKLNGQLLHAQCLGFIHPIGDEYMEFQVPVPIYFEEVLKRMRKI